MDDGSTLSGPFVSKHLPGAVPAETARMADVDELWGFGRLLCLLLLLGARRLQKEGGARLGWAWRCMLCIRHRSLL